jgi:hypothetical protein
MPGAATQKRDGWLWIAMERISENGLSGEKPVDTDLKKHLLEGFLRSSGHPNTHPPAFFAEKRSRHRALTREVEEQLAIIASNRLYVEQESVIECRSSYRPGTSASTARSRITTRHAAFDVTFSKRPTRLNGWLLRPEASCGQINQNGSSQFGH